MGSGCSEDLRAGRLLEEAGTAEGAAPDPKSCAGPSEAAWLAGGYLQAPWGFHIGGERAALKELSNATTEEGSWGTRK